MAGTGLGFDTQDWSLMAAGCNLGVSYKVPPAGRGGPGGGV